MKRYSEFVDFLAEQSNDTTHWLSSLEREVDPSKPVVAKGVRLPRRNKFTAKFKDVEAFDNWLNDPRQNNVIMKTIKNA